MITHLIFQLLDKFKIGSNGFRKVLAAAIGLMIFGLLFAVVKFMKMEIPNFIRNLAILAGIDLGGFFFLMWKNKGKEDKDGKDGKDGQKKDEKVDKKMNKPSMPPKNMEQDMEMYEDDEDDGYLEEFDDDQYEMQDDDEQDQDQQGEQYVDETDANNDDSK